MIGAVANAFPMFVFVVLMVALALYVLWWAHMDSRDDRRRSRQKQRERDELKQELAGVSQQLEEMARRLEEEKRRLGRVAYDALHELYVEARASLDAAEMTNPGESSEELRGLFYDITDLWVDLMGDIKGATLAEGNLLERMEEVSVALEKFIDCAQMFSEDEEIAFEAAVASAM